MSFFGYEIVKINVVMAMVDVINDVPTVHRSHLKGFIITEYYCYVAKWYTVQISQNKCV